MKVIKLDQIDSQADYSLEAWASDNEYHTCWGCGDIVDNNEGKFCNWCKESN